LPHGRGDEDAHLPRKKGRSETRHLKAARGS
jgi:hypothetical protein